MKCEFELAHAQDERLASARLLEQAEARAQASEQAIAELKQERDALKAEVKKLHDEISKLQKGYPSRKTTELSIQFNY